MGPALPGGEPPAPPQNILGVFLGLLSQVLIKAPPLNRLEICFRVLNTPKQMFTDIGLIESINANKSKHSAKVPCNAAQRKITRTRRTLKCVVPTMLLLSFP